MEVAVPPAPDGDAVGDPSDSTDTTPPDPATDSSRGRQGPLWVLAALLAAVLVCLALVAYFGFVRLDAPQDAFDDVGDPQGQRDQVMAVARTFATQVATYGPEDLDAENRMPGYVERVEELLTPKFATGFEQGVTFAEQSVAQQQISRTAQVYAVGVATLEADTARVLVAGTDTFSVPNPQQDDELVPYDQRTFRYEVALVRTGGKWLVDDYGPAGTLDEPLPEEQPTEAPSDGQPTAPSQDPSESPRRNNQGGGDGQ